MTHLNAQDKDIPPQQKQPKAIVASTRPAQVQLEPGCYYWCTCGKSQTQPYCDGAHWGSSFFPMPFEIKEDSKPETGVAQQDTIIEVKEATKTLILCNCKQTATPPYCDGSHQLLRD